jgi:DNA modification methylase
LTDSDRRAIARLVLAGAPLPARFRAALFPPALFPAAAFPPALLPATAPELVWSGKGAAAPSPEGTLRIAERYVPRAPLLPVDPWRDLLVQADNGQVLRALNEWPLAEAVRLAGGLKLIYIDPPFAVGNDFPVTIDLGRRAPEQRGRKSSSRRIRVPGYRDSWDGHGEDYLSLMYDRLRAMQALLADDGALFLHCDWRSNAQLRLMLDEIFGRDAFVNEIVWFYYNKYSAARHCLPRSHDTILFYAKGGAPRLNEVRLPRDQPQLQLVRENVGGVLKNARGADGKLLYRTVTDRKLPDVWAIPQLQPASRHWTGYPTQKHPALIARILELCTQPGDLVADFFCGAGTLPVVAQEMGRRWIACDVSEIAIHTARKRLLEAGAAFDLGRWSPRETSADRPGRLRAEVIAEGRKVQVRLRGLEPHPLDVEPERAGRAGGGANGLPLDRLAIRDGRLLRLSKKTPPHVRGGKPQSGDVLIADWPEWIDYWSVDFGAAEADEGAPIQPSWWAARSRKSADIPLQSPAHCYRAAGRYAVTVLAVDRLGREYRTTLPVRA